jgi:photosystem II stability/assembly factor-like uncharacterized protein
MHFDLSGRIADHRLRVPKKSASSFRKILVPLLLALVVLAAVAPLIAQKSAPKKNLQQRAGIDLARRRADWFYRQRAYPSGTIPAGAREAAIKALREMREKAAVANPNVSSLTWQSLGPAPTSQTPFGNTSGRVTALVVDPTDSTGKTVYLGAAGGGVWKTTDLQNWTPLTDSQPSLSIGSLALDATTNPPTIYAGTGEENFGRDSYYGAGFLKSTDGGQNWTSTGTGVFGGATTPLNSTTGGPFIGALSVDPSSSLHQVVLAAVKGGDPGIPSGIWRSTNGGASWTQVLSPSPKVEATDVVFDSNDASGMTAYAALGHPGGDSDAGAPCKSSAPCNGVFISTNAGASWTRLTGLDQSSDQTQFGRITLGLGPQVSGKSVIYAAVANADDFSSSFFGLFKSLDAGTTWTQLTTPPNDLCDPSCFYDMAIRVSPANASLVFAGGSSGGGNSGTLYRSVDGGNSWQDVTVDKSDAAIHSAQHALGFTADGSSLFAGNDGGIWTSADVTNTSVAAGAQTWTNLNTGSTRSGLSITQFYPGFTVHPSSDNVAFGGTQGNAAQLYNTNAWTGMAASQCDGGFTAIDAAIPNTVFTTCGDLQQPSSVVPFVFRSLSGGFVNDFVVAENGINTSDPASYLPPIAGDASRSQTFYLATNRLYQTIDNGNTWTPISTDLTGSVGNFLTALAIAPSDSNTVYVGSIDGIVQVSHNALSGSVGFARVIAGLPDRSVTSLAVEATDPTRAYVAFSGFSGFNGDTLGHVFMTTNGGGQWNDISGNLPNIPVNAVVADPSISGTLYIGTDIGVFITTDSGASWQPLGTGLPNAVVLSLNLRSASRVLTAVTHGRGAWDISLGGLPALQLTGISPVESNTAPPISITATGVGFTSQSVIRVSGTPVTPTTLNSDGSLSASIPASALQSSSGVYGITVETGQSVSNSLPFSVSSPAPTITSISPTSGIIGDGTVILTVTGTNFLPNAIINFGNTSVTPGTAGSSTTLTATIPTSALATAAAVNVTVSNPPLPGGGTSNAVVFDVQDYAFGPVTPAVATIKAGATANFTIPVIGLFGFSTEITVTCSTNLPADATCTFNPTNITPTASGATQQLAISTAPNNSNIPPPGPLRRWPPFARAIWLALAALLTIWFALRIRPAAQSSGRFGLAARRAALAMSLAALMFGAGLAGCGGGHGAGTPVGTYQITLTANGSSDGTETATHTTTVTMIVQ